MKTPVKSIVIGALGSGAWLLLSMGQPQAQERPSQGNFDPAQMRQRMLDRMRQQFDVKDDAEWKAISERIEKIMQARRNVGSDGSGGFGFAGGPGGQGRSGGAPPQGGPGGPDDSGPPNVGPQSARDAARGGPGGPGGFGRQPSPEPDALRQALDNKASAAEIKAKLADESRTQKARSRAGESTGRTARNSLHPPGGDCGKRIDELCVTTFQHWCPGPSAAQLRELLHLYGVSLFRHLEPGALHPV